MKKEVRITKIGLNAHTDGNQGFSEFKIEGSVDGIGFTDMIGSPYPCLANFEVYSRQ